VLGIARVLRGMVWARVDASSQDARRASERNMGSGWRDDKLRGGSLREVNSLRGLTGALLRLCTELLARRLPKYHNLDPAGVLALARTGNPLRFVQVEL